MVVAISAARSAETRHGFIAGSVGGLGSHGAVGGVGVGVVGVGSGFGRNCDFWCEARSGKYECCDSGKMPV